MSETQQTGRQSSEDVRKMIENFTQSLQELSESVATETVEEVKRQIQPMLTEAVEEFRRQIQPYIQQLKAAAQDVHEGVAQLDASVETIMNNASRLEKPPAREEWMAPPPWQPAQRQTGTPGIVEAENSLNRELQIGTIIPLHVTPPPAPPGTYWKSTFKGRELREKK